MGKREVAMKELLTCRAMESMCRQRAAFFPGESWKYLAEAEMWRHRALDLIDAHSIECIQKPEIHIKAA
jgi:hypothetical protein